MEKEKLKIIFDFLEEKGENRAPFLWKFKNNIPLTEDELLKLQQALQTTGYRGR